MAKIKRQPQQAIDAPTRLLTWAVRAWKERAMAEQQQKKKQTSDGIPKPIISLYTRLIGDEQTVQLNKTEKELYATLLLKKFPQLSVITDLAEQPAKLPLKARTKIWGNRVFYAACVIGGLFIVYVALKG